MRKAVIAVAVVSGLMLVSAGVYAQRVLGGDGEPVPAASAGAKPATAPVVRTDLSDYWTEVGRVGYRQQRTLRGAADGVVTWLPKSGRSVARGDALFRVDDRPVSLFYGETPMFRDIATIGMVGRDVRVLADNLRAMGFRIGRQPAPGTWLTVPAAGDEKADEEKSEKGERAGGEKTEKAGGEKTEKAGGEKSGESRKSGGGSLRVRMSRQDAVFTQSLKAAVQRWQWDARIQPADGTVRRGDILVLPGEVRVGAASAKLGDDATNDVIAVSAQAKAVLVEADATRSDAIRSGQKVQITLPDDKTTTGTVSSVSKDVKSADDGPADTPKVQVVVTVDKSSAIKDLSAADVEVRFAGTSVKDVLAVPVGALLALSGGGYAVQISGGELTAVETGLFADGMVEVTGDGLSEGTVVVTTS